MTEFVIVLPIFLLLLLGIAQLGIAFNHYIQLTDATRAERASAHLDCSGTCDRTDKVVTKVKASAANLDTAQERQRHIHLAAGHGSPRLCQLPVLDRPHRDGRFQRQPQLVHNGACGMKKLFGHSRSEDGQMLALLAVSIVALCRRRLRHGRRFLVPGPALPRPSPMHPLWRRRRSAGISGGCADAGAGVLVEERGGVSSIQFSSNTFANDTISCAPTGRAGLPLQVLGIASVDVSATAKARAFGISAAKYVAPIAVRRSHPLISGSGCPCFGQPTQISLEAGNPSLGAFKILNVDGSFGGTGSATLTDWLLNGYDGYMSLGWYFSNPGAKFNPSDFADAIIARRGSELLFPIYDETREQGAGYEYRVVGWIGFYVQAFIAQGAGGAVDGYFTRVVWEGLTSESAEPFFGATW